MRHIPRRGGDDGGDGDVVFGCSIPSMLALALRDV
eukprot:CAMPEP_0184859338 /NCGR_PEP_ID=MMETSP0580-20130426/4351_1 /TAXON_ID=1118495 /ORGANISM="Dactyliosolen fragilissimus" /LENGTH=34 /DNA_ID= /DNA_START= /DNA_END= /DNA_ORIENTATION=